MLADLHCHPLLARWIEREPLSVKVPGLAATVDSYLNHTRVDWSACHRAGVDVLCVAHYNPFDELASMPTDPSADAPWNLIRMMDMLEEELERPGVARHARLARNAAELASLVSVPKSSPEYRIAVVHTVEGGHALGGTARPLAELAQRGVFSITVTHFFDNGLVSAANSIPYFPDAATDMPWVGMSERGREVIQEMERLGIVVDVSHATRKGLDDILRVAKGPLIASHSGSRTLSDHPYNLVDEHVQEIARRGGLIGVLLCPYLLANYTQVSDAEKRGGLRDVSRALVYLRRLLAGTRGLTREPHACLAVGTDFGGYIPRIEDMSDVSEIELLRASLADEFGRDPALAGRDHGPILDAILAENAIRFLGEEWGRSR